MLGTLDQPLGQYRVFGSIARGGSADLSLAIDLDSGLVCVVKQLREELESSPAAQGRMWREAQLVARLDHPNIARLLAAGMIHDRFALVLEHIQGQTLRMLLSSLEERGEILPAKIAFGIALAILDALVYAHEAVDEHGAKLELVHRDLKPRNVMISYAGEVKVIDFGIARGNVPGFRTEAGRFVGTFRYASPEQALGQEQDARSDLYSICAVIFEMFEGRPLVGGNGEDALSAIINESMPARLSARIPSALVAILHRGLAKRPEDRFQTARELKEAIQAAREERMTGSDLADYMATNFAGELQASAMMIEGLRSLGDEPPSRGRETKVDGGTFTEPTEREVVELVLLTENRASIQRPARARQLRERPAIQDRSREIEAMGRALRRWRAIAICALAAAAISLFAGIVRQPLRVETIAPASRRALAQTLGGAPRAHPLVEQAEEPEEDDPTPRRDEPSAPRKHRLAPAYKRTDVETTAAATDDTEARLHTLLADLRRAPTDFRLFDRLCKEIEASAAALSSEDQRTVQSAIQAASISGDVDALARAIEHTIRARRAY